jgi:hypothetical protein
MDQIRWICWRVLLMKVVKNHEAKRKPGSLKGKLRIAADFDANLPEKTLKDFLSRGMASAEEARSIGTYVPAKKVLAELRKRLERARRGGK